jgi:hypothetical protein
VLVFDYVIKAHGYGVIPNASFVTWSVEFQINSEATVSQADQVCGKIHVTASKSKWDT